MRTASRSALPNRKITQEPTSRPDHEAPIGEPAVEIDLPYRRVQSIVVAIALTVLVLGIFREVFVSLYGTTSTVGDMRLLNLDSENGFAEWWSVLQFLLAASLLGVHAFAEPNRRWKPYWLGLAAIFVFLSIDESAGVHEATMPLMAHYAPTGFFAFPWIVPYAIACFVIGLVFLPFVLALPNGFRRQVCFSGALFLAAALGVESLSGYCATAGGTEPSSFARPCYPFAVVTEEAGEIIAICIFILALLSLLAQRARSVTLNVKG